MRSLACQVSAPSSFLASHNLGPKLNSEFHMVICKVGGRGGGVAVLMRRHRGTRIATCAYQLRYGVGTAGLEQAPTKTLGIRCTLLCYISVENLTSHAPASRQTSAHFSAKCSRERTAPSSP